MGFLLLFLPKPGRASVMAHKAISYLLWKCFHLPLMLLSQAGLCFEARFFCCHGCVCGSDSLGGFHCRLCYLLKTEHDAQFMSRGPWCLTESVIPSEQTVHLQITYTLLNIWDKPWPFSHLMFPAPFGCSHHFMEVLETLLEAVVMEISADN